MLRHLLILLLMALTTSPAFAKKVMLEWAPEKLALYYEIEVKDSSGKKHVHRRIDQSQYRGKLDPGVYFWQIRTIDRLKRPGRWSEPEPLVVMAAPPSLQSPDADAEIKLYHSGATVPFKWKPVPGATAYLFKLSKDGSPDIEKEVTDPTLEIAIPEAGHYTWTVHSVLTPGAGAPAAHQSRRWQSDGAEALPLKIEHETLAKAEIIEPMGAISMPEKTSLRFTWTPVENAGTYEVRIGQKVYRPKTTSITINIRDLGPLDEDKHYTWSVRPIPVRAPASYALDSQATAVSSAEFQFGTEMRDLLRSGAVEFNTFLAPTSYRFAAPDTGQSGDTTAVTSGFRISGVRYTSRKYGYGGAFENLTFKLADQSYASRSFEFGAHYRRTPSKKEAGWLLNARLGLGWKEYVEVFPTVFIDTTTQTVTLTGVSDLTITTLGPASGVELKRFLTDRWTIQFNFSHYFPLMKVGSSQVSSLQSAGLLDNTAFGVRGGWESRSWGYTFGIVNERRSLKFNRKLENGSTSSQTDETTSSAWNLYGGVSYSFY